ncbi:MAG: hypothetical protein GY705_07190 [Bacteroidetes bacterium]|nr:hypothetical protein [Bacteroidota bacterium]
MKYKGELLMEKGASTEAITTFLIALDSAHFYDLNPLIGGLYESLSQAYDVSGQLDKALEYKERAVLMNALLKNKARLKTIDELEIRYQTSEKERQLVLVENENLLKSRQLNRSQRIIFLLTFIIFITLLIARNTQHKKKVAQLLASKKQMQHEKALTQLQKEKDLATMQALFTGQEQERKRIANDLHDSLGGLLYSLQLQVKSKNKKAEKIIQIAITENRRICEKLLPSTLVRLGLSPALKEWTSNFQNLWTIPVNLQVEPFANRMPEETEIAFFRIAQELMTNAARHAHASLLNVQLFLYDNTLHLLVEDNGKGFNPNTSSPHFLKTVASRTQLLRGHYEVDSTLGRGTTVIVKIPYSINNNYS